MLYEPARVLGAGAGGGHPVSSGTDWATRKTTRILINASRLQSVLSEEHIDLRQFGSFPRSLLPFPLVMLAIPVKRVSTWKIVIIERSLSFSCEPWAAGKGTAILHS